MTGGTTAEVPHGEDAPRRRSSVRGLAVAYVALGAYGLIGTFNESAVPRDGQPNVTLSTVAAAVVAVAVLSGFCGALEGLAARTGHWLPFLLALLPCALLSLMVTGLFSQSDWFLAKQSPNLLVLARLMWVAVIAGQYLVCLCMSRRSA